MALVACPNCGFANIAEKQNCKNCNALLSTTTTKLSSTSTVFQVSATGHEYLVVPFVGEGKSGTFIAKEIANQLQAAINHYVAQGWDYYGMEKVNIVVPPGCLASLLGATAQTVTYDQIIFRRQQPNP
jgi:hypothetical protein